LAIDNPLDDPESVKVKTLEILDIVITACFILECALKVVAYGFVVNGRSSYLKNGWNVLDFAIVVISVFSLSMSSAGAYRNLKALRTFRVLRPLRLISRLENLRLVIDSLIRSIPSIGNVLLI
jgi:hypothetical protein